MTIPAETTVEKKSQVVARELNQEGEAVLLHLETGSYHGVDHVGWLIWSLIDGQRTVREIASEVRSRLDGAPEHVEEDVTVFLERLRERDLIE